MMICGCLRKEGQGDNDMRRSVDGVRMVNDV